MDNWMHHHLRWLPIPEEQSITSPYRDTQTNSIPFERPTVNFFLSLNLSLYARHLLAHTLQNMPTGKLAAWQGCFSCLSKRLGKKKKATWFGPLLIRHVRAHCLDTGTISNAFKHDVGWRQNKVEDIWAGKKKNPSWSAAFLGLALWDGFSVISGHCFYCEATNYTSDSATERKCALL